MARFSRYMIEGDVSPQAVFWRPLKYFSVIISDGEDGLDFFKVISFTEGNDIRFDLRTYRRHEKLSVTLYLPSDLEDQKEVARIIDTVIDQLGVPKHSVAWRRGVPFEFGVLKRPKGDRLRETEARILALKIAAQQPDRTASTEDIKKAVPSYIELSALDLAQSKTRPREKMWQQIVGNVISHKGSPSGLFINGYARRTPDGLSVTEKGMSYLNSLGFFGSSVALAE